MWKLALFLAAVAVTLLMLPFAVAKANPYKRTLLIAACGCAALALLIGKRLPPPPRNALDVADFRPLQVGGESDPYATSSTCRDCHQQEFESWHQSYHRTMTQIAEGDAVIGDFDNVNVSAYGRQFHMTQQGDEYWVTMHDPESDVINAESIIHRPIVMTTGSHHMQVYWYATGKDRRVGQLPIVWLKETQSWVPIHSIFVRPTQTKLGSAEGRWNQTCIKCHTTQGRPRIQPTGRPPVDTHVAEFGIACEACHGPGTEHVLAHGRENNVPAGAAMVHPHELEHHRSAEVCGQCHGVWIAGSENEAQNAVGKGLTFRPGDELAATRHVFSSEQAITDHVRAHLAQDPDFMGDRFWGDGMVRVSGREYNGLIRSPCFQKGQMTCLSCHELHPEQPDETWRDDQLKAIGHSNEACLQCHSDMAEATALTAHTHHAVNSSGSQCYNCHMPHTTYGLLKAIRSHEISSPSASETLQWGRPNACNQCHLDETLAWSAQNLESWYGVASPLTRDNAHDEHALMVEHALSGDAGQRALAAWAMGWSAAQATSSTDWAVPVLAQLLNDPYHAVRFVARRSLRSLSGYESVEVDVLNDVAVQQTVRSVMQQWSMESKNPNAQVLIDEAGRLNAAAFQGLLRKRNNRVVVLSE